MQPFYPRHPGVCQAGAARGATTLFRRWLITAKMKREGLGNVTGVLTRACQSSPSGRTQSSACHCEHTGYLKCFYVGFVQPNLYFFFPIAATTKGWPSSRRCLWTNASCRHQKRGCHFLTPSGCPVASISTSRSSSFILPTSNRTSFHFVWRLNWIPSPSFTKRGGGVQGRLSGNELFRKHRGGRTAGGSR